MTNYFTNTVLLKEVKEPALILNLPKEKETSKIGMMVIIVLRCIPRGGITSVMAKKPMRSYRPSVAPR